MAWSVPDKIGLTCLVCKKDFEANRLEGPYRCSHCGMSHYMSSTKFTERWTLDFKTMSWVVTKIETEVNS